LQYRERGGGTLAFDRGSSSMTDALKTPDFRVLFEDPYKSQSQTLWSRASRVCDSARMAGRLFRMF